MVFCNEKKQYDLLSTKDCHNPYFNRWFSAIIKQDVVSKTLERGHNPYFNRWFSAIGEHLE